MSIKDQITEDMKSAMRAKETDRLGTIRLLLAAIKQREVDERVVMDDTQIVAIVEKLIKQRKDSVAAFELASRADLVAKEQSEIVFLKVYLPEQMTDEAVAQAVSAAIEQSGASSPSEMGKVMAIVKPLLAGKTDMGKVSAMIKAKLAGA